jgi:hypothetical protein
VGSLILGPAPQPCQGQAPPNSHTSGLHDLPWAVPLRLAQACMISTLLGPAPKTCQASNPHMHDFHSTAPCPSGLHRPAPHRPAKPVIHRCSQSLLRRPVPLRLAQACMISALPGHAHKACQDGDPHMQDLCWDVPSGLHRPALGPCL